MTYGRSAGAVFLYIAGWKPQQKAGGKIALTADPVFAKGRSKMSLAALLELTKVDFSSQEK